METFLTLVISFITAIVGAGVVWFLLKNKIRELKDKLAMSEANFNKFGNELQVVGGQIAAVAEQLYITLDENNVFAKQIFDETNDMARLNTEQMTSIESVIEESSRLINMHNNTGLMSQELKQLSSSCDQIIADSILRIDEISKIIKNIMKSTSNTRQSMEKLNETASKIGEILIKVSNVAKKTGILSLNASIEAVRAGEAGRGFKVVADEIRKLAEESNIAVKDIVSLVSEIDNEINDVNSAANENFENVNKTVNISNIIDEDLHNIKHSFGNVMEMVNNIKHLSDRGSEMTENLVERLEETEKLTVENKDSVGSVLDSVHKQKHDIEDLAALGVRLSKVSDNMSEAMASVDSSIVSANVEVIKKAVDSFEQVRKRFADEGLDNTIDFNQHKSFFKKIIEEFALVEAGWSNDVKGRFICSVPEAGIANANVREWFKEAIAGKEYVSQVYISAITKNPCLTLSTPFYTEDGVVKGVIGIDIKLI